MKRKDAIIIFDWDDTLLCLLLPLLHSTCRLDTDLLTHPLHAVLSCPHSWPSSTSARPRC